MLKSKLFRSLVTAGCLLLVLLYCVAKAINSDANTWMFNSLKIQSTDANTPYATPIRWDNYRESIRELDFDNSTALFNSIRAALRQAASDIHPVGVSYFPAVIPEGTLMYHAGSEVPTSFEWLAMDHEFSYSFGLRTPSYGRKSLRRHGPPPPNPLMDMALGPNSNLTNFPGEPDRKQSMMLTFRATRDLNRLLYLDGASAAKTDGTGEMDTQELLSDVIKVKLNLTDDGDDTRMKERLFASRICKWGKPFGLSGIVRVEVGFEIILCDFSSDDVELVSKLDMVFPSDYLDLPPPTVLTQENGWPIDQNDNLIEDDLTAEQRDILAREDSWEDTLSRFDATKGFNWLLAGAIHDKGDKRISLDYRHTVTGINRTYIHPDANNRRLLNSGMTWAKQLKIVEDLEQALCTGFDASASTDWQQVFDETVDKFAPMLKVMSNILNRNASIESRAINATSITLNFVLRFMSIDEGKEQFGAGKQFAVYQYTRPLKQLQTDSDYLIWSAAVNIVTRIVDAIYDVNDLLTPLVRFSLQHQQNSNASLHATESVDAARTILDKLIKLLGWIEFDYSCNTVCGWNEVCYTPSWGPSPMGMEVPSSNRPKKGTHFDEARQRLVIDKDLQCVSVEDILYRSR
ncbi:LADA_0D13410g1_1 [Lachancea dasiensis]|uniref:LADA_0D13410g1_1 n=1 Tax=Lachancea dasiensis TaxID=1072105 RepID=A0A1G4J8G4_9SACH|nr:LADA_0D13410g1_1 [Lachancea dasiensis]